MPPYQQSGDKYVDVGQKGHEQPQHNAPNYRQTNVGVSFPVPFKNKPAVVASLRGMDIHHENNARIGVSVSAITPYGFTAHVCTWADTKVWSATVAWTAYDNTSLDDAFRHAEDVLKDQQGIIMDLQLAVENLQSHVQRLSNR